MAKYTPNLNLYEKDPVADATDTFNIKTMMNDNWDKIDENFGNLNREVTEHLEDSNTRAINVLYPPANLTAAVGDGVHDDTMAIQSVINYVSSNGGGIVLIPKGTYIISQLILPSNIVIKGLGIGITNLKQKNQSNAHFIINNDIANGNSNIRVENLSIDGNKEEQTAASNFGIYLDNITKIEINSVEVKNCLSHGIDIRNGSYAYINNCFVHDNSGHGINLNSTDYTDLIGNSSYNNDIGYYAENSCSYLTMSSNFSIKNNRSGFSTPIDTLSTSITLSDNVSFSNGYHGFEIQGNDIIIDGNIAAYNGTTLSHQGILINAKNVIVSNNHSFYNTGVGIDLGNCESVSVIGNNVYQNSCFGIECNSSDNIIIDSNIVKANSRNNNSSYSGIIIYADGQFGGSSTDIIIKGNRVTNGNTLQQNYGIELRSTAINVLVKDNIVVNGGVISNILDNKASGIIRDNSGYKNENIVSATFPVDSIGLKTIIIPHGLNITPTKSKIIASVDTNLINDFLAYSPMIDNVDSSNVVLKVYVSAASATSGAFGKVNVYIVN